MTFFSKEILETLRRREAELSRSNSGEIKDLTKIARSLRRREEASRGEAEPRRAQEARSRSASSKVMASSASAVRQKLNS